MAFSRRRFGLLVTTPALAAAVGAPAAVAAPARPDVVAALRRAATFLDERLSYRGGYVWSYLPDLSRTWGEMEANRTMCWVQP
ncbi:MAG: pectate lyase, partial [Saccharothrix sp.]|nr:pectate lyase [Saccharothrix sp.]